MVAFSPDARGLGVSRKRTTPQGVRLKHVTLHVIEKNMAVKRLYNRKGFVDEELVLLPLFLLLIFTFQLSLFLLRIFTCKAAWFQRKPLTSLLPFSCPHQDSELSKRIGTLSACGLCRSSSSFR